MTDAERIAELEALVAKRDGMLKSAWALMCDALLLGEQPDEIKRRKAFYALDKFLRDEKLLP